MYYLLSILFGLIPEVLYFTLFLTYTKGLKEKRLRLFFAIAIAYFICILFQRYQLIYYMLFVILIYIESKMLYKKKIQIIDLFIISIALNWVVVVSGLLFCIMKFTYANYILYYIIDRIILFSIFIFKNKFNSLYRKYCEFWNRNDNKKRPIKSITLRNISLISTNLAIYMLNVAIAKIIEVGMR